MIFDYFVNFVINIISQILGFINDTLPDIPNPPTAYLQAYNIWIYIIGSDMWYFFVGFCFALLVLKIQVGVAKYLIKIFNHNG